MSEKKMSINLRVWRQDKPTNKGHFASYRQENVNPDMSFLEMLDELNEELIRKDELPVEFDSDCREGICGTCGVIINGTAHGPKTGTSTCGIRMREFSDGETLQIEPFRAVAFPVVQDLVVDREAFDRVNRKGGYISVRVGGVPEALAIPVKKENADLAMDFAACIGCGACVAACPNASASLFVGAKISQLALLPQGQPEAKRRVRRMVAQMDAEQFGACSNHGECEAVCPQSISISAIARMRREYAKSWI
jgi:succinate dehydrogenase / fumarate reductase iron-sulfur subunit